MFCTMEEIYSFILDYESFRLPLWFGDFFIYFCQEFTSCGFAKVIMIRSYIFKIPVRCCHFSFPWISLIPSKKLRGLLIRINYTNKMYFPLI